MHQRTNSYNRGNSFCLSCLGSINIPSSFKSLSTLTRKLSASNSRLIDSLPVRNRNGFGKD